MLEAQSKVVNGQLITLVRGDAYRPTAYQGTFLGGNTPPPTLPSGIMGDATAANAAAASANPWSWQDSPLPWALVFLVISLVILHIHFR